MKIPRMPTTYLVILTAACAAGSGIREAAPVDDHVITLTEVEATNARNALEVVQQLRPRWMVRGRGARSLGEGSADYVRVVVDELAPDDFSVLRDIAAEAVAEIRFLDAREATFQYGTGYTAGIIKVVTKR